MDVEKNSIESLIKGGLIGAAIGEMLSSDLEEAEETGALLVAAFSSTQIAAEEARKTKQSYLVEENNKLYKVSPTGEKMLIKELKKPTGKIPLQFILE